MCNTYSEIGQYVVKYVLKSIKSGNINITTNSAVLNV